jgi:dihydropteroate synthase
LMWRRARNQGAQGSHEHAVRTGASARLGESMNAPAQGKRFNCGRYSLPLSRPLIMGVINITPDSFSDGGDFLEPRSAIAHAQRLVAEGADILDLGGESSRPGSAPVTLEEERRRVLPVLEKVAQLGVPVSIDTTKPELMREVLASGASMINDISALGSAAAVEVIAGSDAGVCLMHMQGDPASMQQAPSYDDVVNEVSAFLLSRARCLLGRGVSASRIAIDPGFGFGKTDQHNLECRPSRRTNLRSLRVCPASPSWVELPVGRRRNRVSVPALPLRWRPFATVRRSCGCMMLPKRAMRCLSGRHWVPR